MEKFPADKPPAAAPASNHLPPPPTLWDPPPGPRETRWPHPTTPDERKADDSWLKTPLFPPPAPHGEMYTAWPLIAAPLKGWSCVPVSTKPLAPSFPAWACNRVIASVVAC